MFSFLACPWRRNDGPARTHSSHSSAWYGETVMLLLLLLLFFLSPRIPDFLRLTAFYRAVPPRNHHRHQLPRASENAIILFRALGGAGSVRCWRRNRTLNLRIFSRYLPWPRIGCSFARSQKGYTYVYIPTPFVRGERQSSLEEKERGGNRMRISFGAQQSTKIKSWADPTSDCGPSQVKTQDNWLACLTCELFI